MNINKEKLKSLWKDPVWSKVISQIIIWIFVAFSSLLILLYSNLIKIPISDKILKLGTIAISIIEIPLWTLMLLILIALFFLYTIKANNLLKLNLKKSNISDRYFPTESSAALFWHRLGKGFPGLRGLLWINDPKLAIERLLIVLQSPIQFKEGHREFESDPIWWFRGFSAMQIYYFSRMSKNKVLMNIEQLKIKRLAVYQSETYYRSFIYVEVYGEKPVGIYPTTNNDIVEQINKYGYSREEYALLKRKYLTDKPIKRIDYDDGSTLLNNKVVDATDSVLRVRYLSNYNFIIAAKDSPYNSQQFEDYSDYYLNGILNGSIAFDDFFSFLRKLPKSNY